MEGFPLPSPPSLLATRSACLALVLALCQPRPAHGEDSLAYRYESWREDRDRIQVDAQYTLLEKDLGPATHLKAMGIIDAIAGATPTGEKPAPGKPVPLARMVDQRKAWSADLSRQFTRIAITAGYATSRESDYLSHGWSLNSVTNFNQKNTLLLLGYGRTDDTLREPQLSWTVDREKTSDDFIAGVTQLLDRNTSLTANLSYGRARGFLSDPYKIVSTTRLDLDPGFYYTPPENRPRHKNRLTAFLGLNRHFERTGGALDASLRLYGDSFGIVSETLSLEWIQPIGDRLLLQPSVRLYRQSAADFYFQDPDRARVTTTYDLPLGETGTGRAPYYSSDYRISRLQTVDLGLKLVWKIAPWLAVDASCNRYVMRGLDHVTPQSAYTRANNISIGMKLTR